MNSKQQTPKEKALILINLFTEPTKVPNVKGIFVDDIDGAKQCALICAEELIKSTLFGLDLDLYEGQYNENCKEYWQEVKSEIEKL